MNDKFSPKYDENGRICTKCGEYRLWEFFVKGSGVNGCSPQCKQCLAKRHKDYYNKNSTVHNKISPYSNETRKKCSKCERLLTRTLFGEDHSRKDGLKFACRECLKAHAKNAQLRFKNQFSNNTGAVDMNKAEAEVILDGMTTIARKVYEAVPMRDTWIAAQIYREIRRKDKAAPALSDVEKSLVALAEARLVSKTPTGGYKKSVGIPDAQQKPIGVTTTARPAEQKPLEIAGKDLLPAIKGLVVQFLAQSKAIGETAAELERYAVAMDDEIRAANEVRAGNDATHEELEKLRQFKAQFKAMMA